MSSRHPPAADPLKADIERALIPGQFVPDHRCGDFIDNLEAVEGRLFALIARDPSRAVSLYDAFLAGCFEKTEELDDSGGGYGFFVQRLLSGWIKARQAAGVDADETAARLLRWMDRDPYGFTHDLAREGVPALKRSGLAAFEKLLRARFDATGAKKPANDRPHTSYERRRLADALRAIYLRRKNFSAYRTLAEEAGLTPGDCLALARMLAGRRKLEEALIWTDRGLALDREAVHGTLGGYDLTPFRRDLLVRLGRPGEALEDAWGWHQRYPCRESYADLMRYVAPRERRAWHEKALAAAERGDLRARLDLLLAVGEIARLADLVRGSSAADLEAVSHFSTEPAAEKLEKDHPEAAAILWRAQGKRIVNAKKSVWYGAAIRNFASAKGAYLKAGLPDAWSAVVAEVRTAHHRKYGFMPGFEKLVAGDEPDKKPAFLERAKARWQA